MWGGVGARSVGVFVGVLLEVAKNSYDLRYVCLPVCPCGTTELSIDEMCVKFHTGGFC